MQDVRVEPSSPVLAAHHSEDCCSSTVMNGPPSPTAQHGHRDHRWSPEQLRKAGVQPKTTSFEDPGLGTGPMSGPLLHRSVLSTSVDVASGSLSAGPYSATNVAVTVPHKPSKTAKFSAAKGKANRLGTKVTTPGNPSSTSPGSPVSTRQAPGSSYFGRAAAWSPVKPLKVSLDGIPMPSLLTDEADAERDAAVNGRANSPVIPSRMGMSTRAAYQHLTALQLPASPGNLIHCRAAAGEASGRDEEDATPTSASGRNHTRRHSIALGPMSPQVHSSSSWQARRGSAAAALGLGERPDTTGQASRRSSKTAVDPQLVEYYTSRQPRVFTPNRLPPVTTSDFKAASASSPGASTGLHSLAVSPRSLGGMYAGGRAGSPGAAGLSSSRALPAAASRLCFGQVLPRGPGMRTVPPVPGSAEALAVAGGSMALSSMPGSPSALSNSSRHTRARSQPTLLNGTQFTGTAAQGVPPVEPCVPLCDSAGALALDLAHWLVPGAAVGGHGPCGLFGGEEANNSVPLLSRAVKALVHCDLGYAEVTESLEFISATDINHLTFRFPVPVDCCLVSMTCTIGSTTLSAEAIPKPLDWHDDDDEDDEAKGKKKGPGSKSNSSSDTAAPGRGRRARLNPNLRVPLPRLKGRQECLIKVSYLMRLQGAAGVWVFTHNASWVPPAHEWHVAVEPDAGSEAGWGPSASSAKHKRSPKECMYDLMYELRLMSSAGLKRVTSEQSFIIKPMFQDTLVQLGQQVWRDTNSVTVNIELATPIPAHSFIRWQDTQHAISAASPLLLAHCTPDPQQSQHSFVSLASMTSMQLRAPSPPPLHALQAPATQPAQGIPPPMPMQHPRRSVAFASFSPAWHFSPAGGGLPPPEGLGSSHVELLVILDLAGAMSVAAIQCMAQAVQVLLQDMPVVAAPSGASFNVMLLPGAAPHATRASRSPVRSPSQSLNKATGSKNSGVNFAAPGEGEQAEGGEALISRKESVSFGTEFGPMPALEADQENAVHKEPSVEMPEPIALFSSGCQPHSISAVQDAVTFLQSQVLSADAEVLGSWAQPRSQVAHLLAQLCEEDADENGTRRAVLLFAAAGAVYQPGVDPKGRDDPLATHLSTRTNRMRLMRDSTVMSCMLAQSGGAPPPKAISTPWLDACVFIVAYGHTPEVAERERVSLFSTMAGTGGPALSPHGSTGHGAGNTAPDCAAQRQASTTGQPRGNAMQYLGLDHTSQGPSFSTSILQRNFSTVMRDDLKGTVFIRPAPSADLEYLDTLARCHAGFYAESKDQADIVASAHLALRCALSGRYLRDPWLSARGAIVRGMHPTPLPQALPLSDQLQLLVRLACLAPGAALQLHGLLPDGCEVVLGQSLEPKDSKMAGCMLPIMQALTEASTTLAENAWATGPGSQELDNNVRKNVLYRMLMHGLASPVTLMQLVGVTRGSDGTISVSTMLDAPAPSARARANSLSAVDEPQQRVRQRPLRWVCTYSEPSAGGGGGGGGGAGASQGATHSGMSAPSGLKSSSGEASRGAMASSNAAQALAIVAELLAQRDPTTGHWPASGGAIEVVTTYGRYISRAGQPARVMSTAEHQATQAGKNNMQAKLASLQPKAVPNDVWATACVLGFLRKHLRSYHRTWLPCAETAWAWLMAVQLPREADVLLPALVIKAASIFTGKG